MIIDVHCHLSDPCYNEVGIAEIVRRAEEVGVGFMMTSGCDLDSSKFCAKISEEYDSVYFCAGFHPDELHKYKNGDLDEILALCSHEKCVAVGEIGLDYHYENCPSPEFQRELFIKQLQLANKADLPVILHSRDAAKETFDILEEYSHLLKRGGVMHCYSYSPEMMDRFLKLGLCCSFGGPSTFKNAKKVQECVRRIPAARILTETDCPYLTPEPKRGVFPNEPRNVEYVLEKMAELRETTKDELEAQIFENAKKLFYKVK